jgi:hypothetical protein
MIANEPQTMDTRSTYLHLLPLQTPEIVDIFDIFNHVHTQVSHWMELFFNSSSSWETDIHAEFVHTETLRHWFVESKNIQKLRGQQTFGFGFPMVIDADTDGSAVAAPIFIWYLSLKPHPTRRDSWVVGFDESHPVVPNEYWLQFVQEKYNIDFSKKLREMALERNFSLDTFVRLSQDIGKKLDFKNDVMHAGLRECPNQTTLERLAPIGDIVWAGALGLYAHQDSDESEQRTELANFLNIPLEVNQIQAFTYLDTDAEQTAAIRQSHRNRLTLVQGAHGSGRTHLAVNALLNALANGQKTAVVATDVATLMEIQKRFVDLGLGNLTFLLKDLLYDKKLLLDSLRAEQQGRPVTFDAEEYRVTLNLARRLQQRADEQHEALHRPIFGDDVWADVVGKYLTAAYQVDKGLLANQLQADIFEFTSAEFDSLTAALHTSEQLFAHVRTLKHPLTALHTDIFANQTNEAHKIKVQEKLTALQKQVTDLQLQHIETTEQYTRRLNDHYESHYEELYDQLQKIKEDLSDCIFQFGDDFETNSSLRLGVLQLTSVFSDRSAAILKAKEALLVSYKSLEKIFISREYKYFEHPFLGVAEAKNLTRLQANLRTFELSLQAFRTRLPSLVGEQVGRMNARTVQHFEPTIGAQTHDLENHLDMLLENINAQNIFSEPLQHKMLTIPKRQQYIEELSDRLDQTQQNMRDFETFHLWQNHWLGMDERAQRLITALVKVKPKNWQAAFESWYFDHVLLIHFHNTIAKGDETNEKLITLNEQIRKHTIGQIGAVAYAHKTHAVKQAREKYRDSYKFFFDAKNQQYAKHYFLKDMLKNGMPTLAEAYPVLLFTPQIANELLEGESKIFDLVVFENAQQFDERLGKALLTHTQRALILSEYAELDGVKSGSLTQFAQVHEATEIQLRHIHRPTLPHVHALNEAAFYPHVLSKKMAVTDLPSEIEYYEVGGQLSEKTQTNEVEIAAIMQLLTEVPPMTDRTYPRIGIVTMGKKQRNAINAQILNIIQKTLPNWEKMEQLQRNGLGIYDTSELDGLQFDTLIVSGTFVDFEALGSIETRALRTLLNAFTHKLIWLNSIDEETIFDHCLAETQHDNAAQHLHASLIAYARAISPNADPQWKDLILKRLSTRYAPPQAPKGSPLTTFLKQFFIETYGASRVIAPYIWQGYFFPIAILPANSGENTRIICFDHQLQKSDFANIDENTQLEKQLEKAQHSVQHISTYQLWKHTQTTLASIV